MNVTENLARKSDNMYTHIFLRTSKVTEVHP
jgi:hypothetical protein